MIPVEWVIAGATLLGPVLAVQAQKWIERAREGRLTKSGVFWTLMATRAARLAPNHVQALNSIEIAYYGWRAPRGYRHQTKGEAKVVAAWRDYFKHLNTPTSPTSAEGAHRAWNGRSNELFVSLLQAMADEARYAIDRSQLSGEHYNPIAHGTIESENLALRQMAIQVLSGQTALRVYARVSKDDNGRSGATALA